jgi:hypothetical protein
LANILDDNVFKVLMSAVIMMMMVVVVIDEIE